MIIKIKNLRISTIIGVFEWEKTVDRELIINVEITTNISQPLQSDEISDTIDYDQIIIKLKNLVANNRFNLVEKLAQTLMDAILEDKRISKCKLEIDKVGVVENVDSFSVTIEQENQNGWKNTTGSKTDTIAFENKKLSDHLVLYCNHQRTFCLRLLRDWQKQPYGEIGEAI